MTVTVSESSMPHWCICHGLFTPLTQTRQETVLPCPRWQCEHSWRCDKTVLSCLRRQCEHNCRQDKIVLSCLRLQCEHSWRQDKIVLSRFQLCSCCRRGQGKTFLSWLRRQCEQAVTSPVDYCCDLFRSSKFIANTLQRVPDAATRIVTISRKYNDGCNPPWDTVYIGLTWQTASSFWFLLLSAWNCYRIPYWIVCPCL